MYVTQHDIGKIAIKKYRVPAEESSSGKPYDVVKIILKDKKYTIHGSITIFGAMDNHIEITQEKEK